MDVDCVISAAEHQGIYVFADDELVEHEFAYYLPEAHAIGLNPDLDDDDVVRSMIHELAHHVDLQLHPDRRDIDGEVIASACEEVIWFNAPLHGVIQEVEQDIREDYQFKESIQVDENDIQVVVDQLCAIISNN